MNPTAGISTKSGLAGAAAYFVAGIANLLAGGPVEATIAGITLSFGSLATVMIGRYAQAVKVPGAVSNIAKIVDLVMERQTHIEQTTTHATTPTAPAHPEAADPQPATVKDKITDAAIEAKRRLGH